MKILITGHKGFIGQNMVNALGKDHQLTLFEWGDALPTFKGLDWCIHLGANSSTTEMNVDKMLEQNYDFSRLIINECQANNVNLQYASSASVYGLGTEFKENAPVHLLSPYAWSKYLFERYVAGLKDRWSNIRVQGFRYFNVYGPHEEHKGNQSSPHHKFSTQSSETGIIKLFEGSENYKRDFVSVYEVIDVHKRFFTVPESGVWNVGTGNAVSFQTVAETIAQETNSKIEYIPMPYNVITHYQKYTCADVTNLRKYYDPGNG